MKKVKTEKLGNLKESLSTKNVRFGSYSTALIVVVIAIAVAFNFVIGQIPEKFTSIDLSPGKLYTIGEKTKKLLKDLDQDVTISVLAEESTSDETLNKLLQRYEDSSDHVAVKYVDPAVNIGAAQTYSDSSQNSLVVSCGTKESVIDYYDIYQSDYSSYYTTGSYSTSFDGEGQLTSAIANVTSDDIPVLYSITGHGEASVGSSVESLMRKQNITQSGLNLMTSGGIPEDCDCLLINAPTSDYSEAEANQIIEYLDGGGRAIILAAYTEDSMTNFSRILEAYGMTLTDGIVMESSNHYYQYPMYVIPGIESAELTSDLAEENANILIPQAFGIKSTDREDVTLTELLSSSSGAYAKKVVDGTISTYEKEDGDEEGPFAYAYLAEKEAADTSADDSGDADTSADGSGDADTSADDSGDVDTSADDSDDADTEENAAESADASQSEGGKVVLISAASLLDESITGSFPQISNLDFYMNCVASLCGDGDDAENISIDAKSLTPEYITVPSFQTVIWLVVTVVIIPLVVLIAGFIIWFRRRKK